MSVPVVVAVTPASPAARAGVVVGDEVVAVEGEAVSDVIRYQLLTDAAEVTLMLNSGGLEREVEIAKGEGEPLGIELDAAVFDRVRTCDNHCEFCFIHQLPPGLRRSLYMKDDDYRLSFLYGNFTTLTRFTEADLERVIVEGLSPLYVSIHATDPEVRVEMLRNRRGATSLRWLRALLDHGIEVHGQIVVCPGLNDGEVLEDTLAGIGDEYPELADVAVVPLGVSRYNTEGRMRPHTTAEARDVLDRVHVWQEIFTDVFGRPLVHAADEYYLLAGIPFPAAESYGDFDLHEDGIGMARAFEREFFGADSPTRGPRAGFFSWVDGAPATGYRAPTGVLSTGGTGACGVGTEYEAWRAGPRPGSGGRADTGVRVPSPVLLRRTGAEGGGARPPERVPVGVLTGRYGAAVIGPLLARLGVPDVRVVEVGNEFFGGNVGVAGLMVGEDVARSLRGEPAGHRYLLPDVCLSRGRFLDGTSPADLPRPVEIVATNGAALRAALEGAGT